MTEANSPYLNQPLRTLEQARRDSEATKEADTEEKARAVDAKAEGSPVAQGLRDGGDA